VIKKSVNSNEIRNIMIGGIEIPMPPLEPNYEILMIWAITIEYEVP
jgi:hypothetical protein